jgi:hypothetical protein
VHAQIRIDPSKARNVVLHAHIALPLVLACTPPAQQI